jgi:hypothetical protein
VKIAAHILRKDRTIKTVKVHPDQDFFTFNNGDYSIIPTAINVTTKDGIINSSPELFYKEGCPTPINVDAKDEATFLDEVVMENALAALAQGRSNVFGFLVELWKNPGKLLLLAFVGIIVYAFLQGMLHF